MKVYLSFVFILFLVFKAKSQSPTISSFSPSSGAAGTLVTINGTNLGSPSGFSIGSSNAIVVSNDGSTLVGMVMPGAGTGVVSITTAGGTVTSSSNFSLISSSMPSTQQGSKLIGISSSSNAQHGFSVAVSADGNTAIVGGPYDNSKGAAWIYVRSGNTWTQQGSKLVGSNATTNANYGYSVAISADGNTVIIGGRLDNSSRGAAWIFTRSSGVWTQQGTKLVGSSSASAQQGTSVAISADGNTAIVGGPNFASWQGYVWVYTRSGGIWTEQTSFVGTGIENLGHFGNAVSLSADGNTALIGGDWDNYGNGAAWIFTRSGNTWSQQGSKLVGTDGSTSTNQGYSACLSADGNTAIIGGFGNNSDQGAAWVFTRSGSTWSQQGTKLVGSGNVGAAKQGNSVSVNADGNRAMIGGFADNSSIGAAWIFTRSGSTWTQSNKLVGTGNSGSSGQGVSVSLSADGSTAIAGGNWDNSNQGAAWVFAQGPPTITSETFVISPSGSATSYNIIANNSPTSFNASGLPTGMSLNTTTGEISISNITAIGRYVITLYATNAAGTGTATLNYYIANGWIGGTGNWSNNSNWSAGTVPNGNADIIVSNGTPTLDNNLVVQSGNLFIINASGALIIAENKVLIIEGTADFGGRSVTIKSSAIGTGSIGQITGTLNNASNVTVERYVSGAGRRWRFLSSPVQSATVANWMTQFYVTGPGDGVTLGAPMSTGWHTSKANIDFPNSIFGSDPRSVKTTSIRFYNESATGNNTNINAGWENLTGTNQALIPGQGFRVFIRGNIGNTGQLDGSVTSQSPITLALTGSINQGNVTPAITKNTMGWNLIGNPYPCSYNLKAQYDASLIGDLNNIDANYYVFDASTNGYKGYNPAAASGFGAGTLTNGIIPSGTAFFIQATGSPTFVFKEVYKTTSSPLTVHKSVTANQFSIIYYRDTIESDEYILSTMKGATLIKDRYDINKLRNENLNLSSYGIDSQQLMLSSIPPIDEETRVKLNVEATAIGTYNFDFKNMDNFQSDITVHLFDRYTNKTIDVRKNTKYTFSMGPGTNQWGKNRFELILNMDKTGINEFNVLNKTQMLVYPNPATDVLNIDISNSSFKNSEIVVYNISGTEVIKTNMASNSVQLNIETLSAGVYFVKVSNQNGFNKTVKFVK